MTRERTAHAALMAAWIEAMPDPDGSGSVAATFKELIKKKRHPKLYDALIAIATMRGSLLGHVIPAKAGQAVCSMCIERVGKTRTNQVLWRVVRVSSF
jgi:hypothetical protein